MIRVTLPYHLRNLASVGSEVKLQVEEPATLGSVLDALEVQYPVLRGAVRDQLTKERRPFIRFFACGQDLSLDSPDTPLPERVSLGVEPFRIVGAMAGG
ncbi:MAG: MoaD/ThiS family protein [Omnitrophica WOR_2 bacterium]